MNPDLLDMFNAAMGGPVARRLSAHLGESDESTRAAIHCVAPVLIASLVQRAASPEGRGQIFRTVTADTVDPGLTGKLSGLFANRGTLGRLLEWGESQAGALLGPRTVPVAEAIADVAGVRTNSALSLLALATPLLLGILKKLVANNDLDASALGSLLQRQRSVVERKELDGRITRALGASNWNELFGALPVRSPASMPLRPTQKAGRKDWMPWAIAAGIAVFGVLFFVNRTSDQQDIPGGAVQIAEVGAGPAEVMDEEPAQVYFESGASEIDREGRMRIAGVAESAKQSDGAVKVTGYPDDGEDRDLAQDRAMAVREALVREGVAADRIVVDSPQSGTSRDDADAR